MNATAQRSHRTVTQDHEARLEALELLVEAMEKRGLQMSKNCDWLKSRVDIQRDDCQERWDSSSQSQKLAFDRIGQFRNMSLMARLKWLVLGR